MYSGTLFNWLVLDQLPSNYTCIRYNSHKHVIRVWETNSEDQTSDNQCVVGPKAIGENPVLISFDIPGFWMALMQVGSKKLPQ